MINEDKVRELFQVALYDSKDDQIAKQTASYYGWDYIGKEGLKSFFTGTFAFIGFIILWVAVNAESLLNRINNLDFKSMGITTAVLYVAFMVIYIFATIVVYASKYKAGRKDVRKYMSHLKAVGKMYAREEKLKR